MLEHDEVSPNGSNGSSPGVVATGKGTVEIDGQEFEYREKGDEIEFVIPEDYPEDQIPELEKKADEFKHTLASAKRKAFEANREKDELAEERKRLEEEKEALRREREQIAKTKATSNLHDNAILEAFGVETWDEVSVLQAENPELYHKGVIKYNASAVAQQAYQRMQTENVQNVIRAEGYNPSSVEAFAQANGITRLDVAFDYYKRVNEKPKGTSLAEIQKKSVKFVPQGAGASQEKKQVPGMRGILDDTKS